MLIKSERRNVGLKMKVEKQKCTVHNRTAKIKCPVRVNNMEIGRRRLLTGRSHEQGIPKDSQRTLFVATGNRGQLNRSISVKHRKRNDWIAQRTKVANIITHLP